MKNKSFLLLPLLSLIVISFTGCTLSLGQKQVDSKTTGGIFKTVDSGQTWTQPVLIPTTSGAPLSIANLDVYNLIMDPSDNKALYISGVGNGMFYSYDAAASWMRVKDKSLAGKSLWSIAVNPKNKCIIYATSANVILKSTDCSRSWEQIYSDDQTNLIIYSLVIDHYDPSIMYLGNTRGDIMKSIDAGTTWQTIKNFGNKEVRRIVMSPSDSRMMLVALKDGQLFRTMNGGEEWTDLKENLKQFKGNRSFRDLISIPGEPGGFLFAVQYGLLKTVNYGDDWTEIKLLTPKAKATINSIAVDYASPQLIYYVTDNSFYRTIDGGQNWSSSKLPTERRGWRLLTDPKNQGLLYLAVRPNEQ